MKPIFKKRDKEAGLIPGTLILPEKTEDSVFRITVTNYDNDTYNRYTTQDIRKAVEAVEKSNMTWIHLEAVDSLEVFEQVGEVFNISSLMLEDMLNLNQRPKIEDLSSSLFLVTRHFEWIENNIRDEQISFLLGKNYLITLQSSNYPLFQKIHERIENNRGYVRKKKGDYLLYCLLDILIDNYFIVMDTLGEKLEDLEEELLSDPSKTLMNTLYDFKNKILYLQRTFFPMREVVAGMRKREYPFLQKENYMFFSDISDHMLQASESLQSYREILTNMYDMYNSIISQKMNEVMKVLTIIGTIFIPLTFVVGVYGMNFHNMPELDFPYGYPILMGFLFFLGIGMFIYFKIKKWF